MTYSYVKDNFFQLGTAVLSSLGLMAFSWFISYQFPWKIISFAALIFSACLIGGNLHSVKQFTGDFESVTNLVFSAGSGILIGIMFAFLYRNYLQQELLPSSLKVFAITAALIGSTEELVFRGFLQDFTRTFGGIFSVLFSTVSHTFYKCCLFISPGAETVTDIGFLLLWTFIVGLILGTTKYLTKNILTAVSAHAFFDIIVYGSFMSAPVWVW